MKPQEHHEALQAARQRQETPEFKAQYALRAGVESTLSQGVRRFDLRQSRYIGLARTHLQQVLTATAMNIVRVIDWLRGRPLGEKNGRRDTLRGLRRTLAVGPRLCWSELTNRVCFVETLSASELEALCTADLGTMRRFLHAFQRWRNGGA